MLHFCKTHAALVLAALFVLLETGPSAAAGPFRQEFGQTRPSGRATLSEQPDGSLLVSNIGSSGQDGVNFDPGRTRGAVGPVKWMAPEALKDRGVRVIVTGEDENGVLKQFAWTSVLEDDLISKQDAKIEVMSSGITDVTITVKNGDNPLYTGTHTVSTNPMYETDSPPTGGGSGGFGDPYDEFGLQEFSFDFPAGTRITIPGVGTFVGDRVSCDHGPWSTEMVALDLVSVVGIEPQGSVGEMRFIDRPGGMFGNVFGSLGGAEILGIGSSGLGGVDRLQVSNIGSSGQDGVAFETDGTSTSQALTLEFPQPPAAGHKLFVGGLSWSTEDGSGTPPPMVKCEYNVDSFFDIWTEVSVNDPPSRIDYLLGDEVVASVLNPASGAELYTSTQYPYRLEYAPTPDGGIDVEVGFLSPVTVNLTGIDEDCDRVRLHHPPDPGSPFYPVDEIFLRAADIPPGGLVVAGCPNVVPPEPISPWTLAAAQGNANVVSPGDGTLRMDNIGSSGLDGVQVSFPPEPVQSLAFSILARRPPNGHVTVLKAFGTPAGVKDAASAHMEIGKLQMDGSVVTGPIEYSADFSTLGPGTVVWNFYDDGVLVGTLQRGNSDTCFGCDLIPARVTTSVGYPDDKPHMIIDLPDDTPITVLGGTKAGPAMNKADLVEVIYDTAIVTPFTDVTDLMLLGVAHGATFLSGMGSTGMSPAPDLAGASVFRLHPAAPNPFNPRTVIAFDLARGADVSLQVFDLRGRLVRNLYQGRRSAGSFRETWDGLDDDGRGMASGTYLFQLKGAGAVQTQKAVLVR